MKNHLLNRGDAGLASFFSNQGLSHGSDRQFAGKPSTSLKSSLASWCAPIIVCLVVIMLGFAVAAVLLGDK